MRRVVYVIAVGLVAAAAAVAVRPATNRARSPQDVRADEERAALAAIDGRTRAREAAATALVRGELTVPQAVARFRDLLADDPAGLRNLGARFPDAPLDELAAHQAAGYVAHRTAGDPYRKAELVLATGRPGPVHAGPTRPRHHPRHPPVAGAERGGRGAAIRRASRPLTHRPVILTFCHFRRRRRPRAGVGVVK